MMIAIVALAMMKPACQITIGVGRDGTLFSDRFYGWYKTAPRTIESDLHGGCYNDANPLPVSSVTVELASGCPETKVDLLFSILEGAGWHREKVQVQPWKDYPKKPGAR